MSDIPHQTAIHCQDAESEKTETVACNKNVHCFKETSSSKSHERTKGKWSSEEDELLTQMVNKHGLSNWQTVARAIPNRNALQCRMRWKNNLDPAINKGAWTEQEELRLIRAHQLYGNKWLKMVKHFPGRTNYNLKEYWRGPMKRKLDSYLASGLLEQVPDLHDDISAPDSSQSNIPKDSASLSDRKLESPAFPTSPKSKEVCTEQGSDSSEGECSDFTNAKGLSAHSAKASERIMAKSNQLAAARKKLDFLSTPVELKVCNDAVSYQRPIPKMEQMNPSAKNISSSDVCQDGPPNVPSGCVDMALSEVATDYSNIVPSSETPQQCTLDIHDDFASDLLDMSYCDDLMMDFPSFPHIDNFI